MKRNGSAHLSGHAAICLAFLFKSISTKLARALYSSHISMFGVLIQSLESHHELESVVYQLERPECVFRVCVSYFTSEHQARLARG